MSLMKMERASSGTPSRRAWARRRSTVRVARPYFSPISAEVLPNRRSAKMRVDWARISAKERRGLPFSTGRGMSAGRNECVPLRAAVLVDHPLRVADATLESPDGCRKAVGARSHSHLDSLRLATFRAGRGLWHRSAPPAAARGKGSPRLPHRIWLRVDIAGLAHLAGTGSLRIAGVLHHDPYSTIPWGVLSRGRTRHLRLGQLIHTLPPTIFF